MGQKCLICSNVAIAENVDKMLRNKTPMSRIAALAGCSKSAVGRHSQRCVPEESLKKHGGAAYHNRRLVVEQGNPPTYHLFHSGRSLDPSELDYDKDLFLVLCYGSKGGDSPKMLTHEEAQALTEKMEASNKAAKENAEHSNVAAGDISPAPEIPAAGDQVTDS
jgi:hypothetical protein